MLYAMQTLMALYDNVLQSYLAAWEPVEHATETDPEALWWEGWTTVVASEPAG